MAWVFRARGKGPMSRAQRYRPLLIVVVAMLMAGCGTAVYTGEDVRLHTNGDTLYLLARSDGMSRNLCASLGGDVTQVEGRVAASDGRTMRLGRVGGCYTIRHIIVC